EVHYCGYAHEGSFGASSYLIRRAAGNVMVDSPRAAGPLLRRIDAMGGVRLMFLTHQDDVADHDIIHRRYGCDRILHEADRHGGTRGIERPIAGREPLILDADLTVIPVPGHTRGSAALLYREEFLFTGDHLWGLEDGRLGASRGVAWHSWAEQIRSMERLRDVPFRWVLPGHGRRWLARSEAHRRECLEALIERMKRR
ncbi:MAG TPA: hypothetical protein VNI57_06610, partial [Candidatus Saccharimonadales bacterium]|nr:hypothetical protein [Candidatus Saccharimonadales bacterium]